MIIIRVVGLLVFAVALGYTLLRVWHRYQANRSVFRPHIGFTELDGMASLSLLLENGSEEDVWAEEIEIFLSDLVAEQQTAARQMKHAGAELGFIGVHQMIGQRRERDHRLDGRA